MQWLGHNAARDSEIVMLGSREVELWARIAGVGEPGFDLVDSEYLGRNVLLDRLARAVFVEGRMAERETFSEYALRVALKMVELAQAEAAAEEASERSFA